MEISILVPLYNEEESIKVLYSELLTSLESYDFEIIFINDGSFDNSQDIIRDITSQLMLNTNMFTMLWHNTQIKYMNDYKKLISIFV